MSEKKEKQWLAAPTDPWDNIIAKGMVWFDSRATARKFVAAKNSNPRAAHEWKVFPIKRGPGA